VNIVRALKIRHAHKMRHKQDHHHTDIPKTVEK
jgi:hypothetical protein